MKESVGKRSANPEYKSVGLPGLHPYNPPLWK